MNGFRRYPALTISLYPPIFPVAEAIAFSIFGFSHPVAQATVAAFAGLAAWAAYRLGRTAVDPLEATSGVLLLFAAPTILLWSRQVMMELPSLGFLLLAAGNLLRYQSGHRSRDLMLATLLLLGAVYTKQTAIFAAPAFAIALVAGHGWQGLRDRHVWAAAAIGLIGLLPLAAFTVIAAPGTLEIALGQGIAAQSGGALRDAGHFARAYAYIGALPEVIGWPLLIAAAAYLAFAAARGWQTIAEKRLAVLMLAWFGCAFLFVSAVGHFEPRYALPMAVPCAALTLLLLARLSLPPGIVLATGILLFGISAGTQHVGRIAGYDKVAAYVLDHSSQNDVIWFQGNESKNLAFSLRSRSSTPKVFLLRAEKFLVDYHIIRDWGVSDRGWTPQQLHDLVDRTGISMVVLEPDFWADLPSMGRMQEYIRSERFTQVAEFRIASDEPSHRVTIKIFVNNQPAVNR
jgi:4-amino-4-deoxy-L-arabinose transferase-like glycosyltransferase